MHTRGRVARPCMRRMTPRTMCGRSDGTELEVRMTAEFWRYALDIPEAAFPTFLESLYFDSLGGHDPDTAHGTAGACRIRLS